MKPGERLAGFRELAVRFLDAAAFCAILFPLLGLLGSHWWGFDLLAHFRWQYVAALVIGSVFWGILRKWIRAGILLFAAIALALPFLSYFQGRGKASDSRSVKLLSFNVLKSNDRHEAVRSFLLKEDADLVFLMEMDGAWIGALNLSGRYPYFFKWPRQDNFGFAVFSKFPIEDTEVLKLSPGRLPSIRFRIRPFDHPIDFIGTHPCPPVSAGGYRDRNFQLAKTAEITSQEAASSRVVLGDLNLSPFSPWFGRLLRESGLHDSAEGFGLPPTWMAGTLLAIPIDHCLISPDLSVLERRTGPRMGSDHSPLIVRIAIPEPGSSGD